MSLNLIHSRSSDNINAFPMDEDSNDEFTPDFISVIISSWAFIVAYSIWTIVLLIMIIVRRNHQPVKARSPLLMVLTLLTTAFLGLSAALRYAISRDIFPCIIYTISFTLMPPGLYLPTVLRSWRLFVVYRMSVLKRAIGSRGLRKAESMALDGTAASIEEAADLDNEDDDSEDVQEEINATLPDSADKPNGQAINDVESEESNSFAKRTGLEKLLRGFNIFVSTPFFLGVFAVVFGFHIALWIGLNMVNPSLLFSFTRGCLMPFDRFVAAGIDILLFLILQTVVSVPVLFVKDTWFMRFEIYFNIVQWFLVLVIFVGSTFIPWINTVGDSYLPYGYVIYVGCFLDNFVSCFIPIVASYVLQRRTDNYRRLRQEEADTELEETGSGQQVDEFQLTLQTKQLRRIFKQFAVQSLAPQSIICWEYIERYKSLKNGRKRYRLGREILDKFMSPVGDFELNLPAEFKPREYWKALKEAGTNPPRDLFDQLQQHCESDMIDLFCRFILRSEFQKAKTKFIGSINV